MIEAKHFQRTNGLNCAEYVISGVARYLKRDFELMYIGAWGYDLDYTKSIFETGFLSDHASNAQKYLEEFHGIQIRHFQFSDYRDFEALVHHELAEDRPVMVTVDLFWVPWTTQNYLKIKWEHEMLIVGKNNEGWLCYDYFNSEANVMPFDHMEKCFHFARTFRVLPEKQINYLTCIRELKKNIIQNIIETDAFNKLAYFGEKLLDPEALFCEQMNTMAEIVSFQKTDLMETINRLSQTRSQYALMLRFIAEHADQYKQLMYIAEKFEYTAAIWKSIWGMMQKAYMIKEKKAIIARVGNKIKDVAQIEKEICDLLLNIEDCHIISVNEDVEAGYHALKQRQIPLDEIANHKGIDRMVLPIRATFQSGFLVADTTLQKGDIICNDTKYRICSLEQQYDNVACVGQDIPINMSCTAVSVLCCAEFAHQIEELSIHGKNNVYSFPFCVTSWGWSKPEFKQTIAWEGSEGILSGTEIRTYPLPRHIYHKTYYFAQEINVEMIRLPYCPNIHIFGITVHY